MNVILLLVRGLATVVLGAMMFVALLAFLFLNTLSNKIYDPQFYIQTLREQDAYSRFYNQVLLDAAVDETADALFKDSPVVLREDLDSLLREIIPQEYLQGQVEANLLRATDYLNEETDALEIYLELDPLLSRIGPAILAHMDRKIDQTRFVRPDPGLPIQQQIAEVETVVQSITRDLIRGKLPSTVPSLESLPEPIRGAIFDQFMNDLLRDPSLDSAVKRPLRDASPLLRQRFTTGDTRLFLKEVVRTVAVPLVDDVVEQTKHQLDSGDRLDLVALIAELEPEITEEQLREDIARGREHLNRLIFRGKLFTLLIIISSAIGIAAVHVPNAVHSVRWSGLTMLVVGLAGYLLARSFESNLTGQIGEGIESSLIATEEMPEAAARLLADLIQAFAQQLVEGMGNPGLVLGLIGLSIFLSSFLLGYMLRKKAAR